MTQEIIAPLTDDEYAVLMIAAQGESMMPIGRWETPVESLVARGFLEAKDKFNNTITPAGSEALAAYDGAVTNEFLNVMNRVRDERPELLDKKIPLGNVNGDGGSDQ